MDGLTKALPAVISSLVLAALGVLGAWVAHWKVQELSRKDLIEALEERRDYAEERDKILAGVREELAQRERRILDLSGRITDLESQFVIVVGQRLRCERWIREARRVAKIANYELPPWDEN